MSSAIFTFPFKGKVGMGMGLLRRKTKYKMGKLRHVAFAVPNTDETAKFYEHARNSWRLPV